MMTDFCEFGSILLPPSSLQPADLMKQQVGLFLLWPLIYSERLKIKIIYGSVLVLPNEKVFSWPCFLSVICRYTV